MNIFVIIILVVILGSLAFGMYYMIKDGANKSNRMVKALTWRIGLSIGLFALLILGYLTGLLQPHGIVPQQPPSQQEVTK